MIVKIKKLHPNAVIPKYAKLGDAGLDLTCIDVTVDDDGIVCYDTGLILEIPEGYLGMIFPRSSLSTKDLILANHVGIIDSGYRGTIKLKFKLDTPFWTFAEDAEDFITRNKIGELLVYANAEDEYRKNALIIKAYSIGDRIGQLIIIPYPQIEFEVVEELSETIRGTGGFGSSGN